MLNLHHENPPKRRKESNKRTTTMNTNRESSRALASSHVLVRSDSPSSTNHCQHRLKYRADADQPFAHKHEREQLTRGRFLASHSREQKEGESNETSNTNLKAELEPTTSSPTTCWPRTTPRQQQQHDHFPPSFLSTKSVNTLLVCKRTRKDQENEK